MPMYVHTAGAAAATTFVLIFVAPVPMWARVRAYTACRLLMILGAMAFVASLCLPALGVWYPSLVVAAAALTMWFVMFWFAREDPIIESAPSPHDEGNDDNHGGGGGPPPPPTPPQRPAGGIDWDEFDRERRAWERDREPSLA